MNLNKLNTYTWCGFGCCCCCCGVGGGVGGGDRVADTGDWLVLHKVEKKINSLSQNG